KVSTGSLIMVFEVAGAAPVAAAAPVAQAAAPVAAAPVAAAPAPVAQAAAASDFVANDAYVHASPAVRRLAREFGVNLA
ncbi:E3 binding domain-containing protein, partial [Escherichia coli]|uniref:E3 binding domain-containing protein n=3 Tax=Gammaproteobacteria TaxID=1236 RepID=UPI0028DF4CB5